MTNFLQVQDNASVRIPANALNNTTVNITLSGLDTTKLPAFSYGYILTIWDDATYPDPGSDPNMEKAMVTGAVIATAATGTLTLNRPFAKVHTSTPRAALLVLSQHLNEITAAINANEVAIALRAPINNPTFTGTVAGITKAMVGLSLADNTSDVSKNVLSATKLTTARTINGVAFDGTGNITIADSTKEPVITIGTTGQYWRGDKTWQTLDKSAVGLPNVDNTTDANKPVSSATQTALNAKATLLNIPQYSVPYRDLTGSGEAHTNLLVASGVASAGTLAMRDAAGAIFAADGTVNGHAVNLAQLTAGLALQLSITGGTLTGPLTITTSNSSPFNVNGGSTNNWHYFTNTTAVSTSNYTNFAWRANSSTGVSTILQLGTRFVDTNIATLTSNSSFSSYANGVLVAMLQLNGQDVVMPQSRITLGSDVYLRGAAGGLLGIGTVPTHTITMGAAGTGYRDYRSADQVTNTEFAHAYWNSTTYTFRTGFTGTGTGRDFLLGSASTAIRFRYDQIPGSGTFHLSRGLNVAGVMHTMFDGTFTQSSGMVYGVATAFNYTQSGTSGSADILLNRIETSLGSGEHSFLDFQVSGVRKFRVDNTGKVTAPNVVSTYVSNTEPTSPVVGDLWVVV